MLRSHSPFSKFTLGEDFKFYVDERPLSSFSGGETALVCAMLRLALVQEAAAMRFGTAPLVVFDSSFDSLDEENFRYVLSVLQRMPFKQCIVTSHNDLQCVEAQQKIELGVGFHDAAF